MYEKKMNEKRNDLITSAEGIVEKAKAEERELTEAEAAELAEICDNVRSINNTLDAMTEVSNMETVDVEDREQESRSDDSEKTRAADERAAFEAFLRGTVNERAANMTMTDNGAVIPTTIARQIMKKVYDTSPILERSTKYNVKGRLEVPYYDETNGEVTVDYAEEFTELTSNVGRLRTITLTGFLAGALTKISRSLINNVDFNIVDFVVDEMAEKIRRWIEKEMLHGTEGKVRGLSTLTNVKTLASTSAITADDLILAQGMIPDVYQNNAIWIMSPATRDALRLLKDGEERYLLNDDITSPFGKTLLGKPVYVSDNMDDIGAGKMAVYYGDFAGVASKFAEDVNVQVLREHFATEHAVGVIGWVEFDAAVVDNQKIVGVKMASA